MSFDRFVLFVRRVRGSHVFCRFVRLGDDFYAPQFILFPRRRRLEFLDAIRKQKVQTFQELIHGFRFRIAVHQSVWIGRSERVGVCCCASSVVVAAAAAARGGRGGCFASGGVELFQPVSQNSHGSARIQPSLLATLQQLRFLH